jgi:integrase
MDSGARPGELFALHWSDVDWSASEVFIHRGLEENEMRGVLIAPERTATAVLLLPLQGQGTVEHCLRQSEEARDCSEEPAALRKGRKVPPLWI